MIAVMTGRALQDGDGWGRHMGRYHDGPHWIGMIVFAVLVAAVIALVVWTVVRLTGRQAAHAAPPPQGWPRSDAAVESLRVRYARGEVGRDDFVRMSADLGAPVAPAPPVAPDDGGGA